MGDVTQALAVRGDGAESLIDKYRADLVDALPSHLLGDQGRTWLRAAHNALRTNAELAKAANNDPGSLLNALAEAAELGHRPGSDSYYLVPLKGRVEGWEGYKGLIERMYRSGQVGSVVAELVYERDEFSYSPGPGAIPQHTPYPGEDPGKMVRVYAYAQMVNGAVSKVAVLRERDVNAHRSMSKGADAPTSPWKRTPGKMWLKCAVKELSAWVPLSVEWRPPAVIPGPPVDEEPVEAEIVDG